MMHRFFSDAALYALSTLLSRSIGLLLLPLYTRYLSPVDYGIMELLAVASALFNIVLPLEISQGVARLIPASKDIREKIGYASTAFWFTACVFTALAALVWMAPATAAQLLLGSEEHAYVARLGVVAMAGNAMIYAVQNQLRWNLQPRAAMATSTVYALSTTLVSALLIVGFETGVSGYIWGQIAGGIAALCTGLRLTQLRIAPVWDAAKLREMLAFSMPLVLSGIAVYATNYIDRWMLRTWLELDAIGIYGAAYRIASLPSLLVVGFQMALVPLVYHHHQSTETPLFVRRIFNFYLVCAIATLAFLAAFAAEINELLTGPAFQPASTLIIWLALAYVLMNVYFFAPGMGLAKKTGLVALVNLSAAGVNIVLNLAWIPWLGTLGAALATLAGGLTMAVLYFLMSHRYYPIPYSFGRIAIAMLVFAAHLGLMQATALGWTAKLAAWALCSTAAALILLDSREWRSLLSRLTTRPTT